MNRANTEELWTDADLDAISREHPSGLSVQEIIGFAAQRGERLTEAAFRKYVQLGLLPRSVRVGRQGKQRGSRGLYPVATLRQLDHLRRLMREGFTIEQIQREALSVRGDVEALSRQVERVLASLEEALGGRGRDAVADQELGRARAAARDLIDRLEGIERRLSVRSRMAHAAV